MAITLQVFIVTKRDALLRINKRVKKKKYGRFTI